MAKKSSRSYKRSPCTPEELDYLQSSTQSPKKQKVKDEEKEDTLFTWFASTTTFHGFSRVVESSSKLRKIVWLLAIMIAFCVVVTIISERVIKYFRYETTTQIEKVWHQELEFPSVTICNFNMIRLSKTADHTGRAHRVQSPGFTGVFSDPGSVYFPGGLTFNPDYNASITWDNSTDDSSNFTDATADTTTIAASTTEPLTLLALEPEPLDPVTAQLKVQCSYRKCLDEELNCPTLASGCCLPKDLVCNGFKECRDGADEVACAGARQRRSTAGVAEDDSGGNTTDAVDEMALFETLWENGWQLVDKNFSNPEESTLLECFYNKGFCNSKWFKKVLTKLGTCYTFNHEDVSGDLPVSTPLIQRLAGPQFGLGLTLDLQEFEYSLLDGRVGAKVLIHNKGETPDLSQEGINVPVGFRAHIQFEKTQTNNLYKPWGDCMVEKKLTMSDRPYTFKACAEECRLQQVLEKCKCKPYFMNNHDIRPCNDSEWYGCTLPLLETMDEHFADYCDCPPGCLEMEFNPQVSYTRYSKTFEPVNHLNQLYFGSPYGHALSMQYGNDYYRENVIGLQIYYGSMVGTNITQLKVLDELSLVGQIGGHLGLFVGVSILTLCEVVETIIMACHRRCHSSRKLHATDESATSV